MAEALLPKATGVQEGDKSPSAFHQLQRSLTSLERYRSEETSGSGEQPTDVSKVVSTFKRQCTSAYLDENPEEGLTGRGLFCNLVLSIIGTSVLGIAAQMKRAGWIFAPALLVFGCVVVVEMTNLVSLTIDKMISEGLAQEVKAYPNYAEAAFGKWGLRLTALTSCLSLIGMICSGMIVEAQNLNGLLPLEDHFGCESCGKNWWAVILSATTLFYCFVTPSALFQASAYLGPICCIVCVVLALIGAGTAFSEHLREEQIPRSCEDQSEPFWYFMPPSGLQVAAVSAYMFYCFACVTTVPTLKYQMAEPRKLVPAASGAYGLCSFIFLVIMLVGYAGFGNFMPDNLIQGMRVRRPEGWWATTRGWETGYQSVPGSIFGWIITVNLLLTDAMFIPCTVMAVEQLHPELFTSTRARSITLRLFISLIRLLGSTCIESFVTMTTLTSALFCVIDNILLPIIAFYSLRVQEVGLLRKSAHVLIFLFGIMIAVFGTYSAIADIVESMVSTSSEVKPGTYPAAGISGECADEYSHRTHVHRAN